MIQIEELSFKYGSFRALIDVSVRWQAGEIVAIVGRNGSGKTTLARCIAGFLKPEYEELKICGRDVRKLRPRERVQLVGYVFQNPDHQIFRETVEDEVLFGLNNIRVPADEARSRCREILQRLDLEGRREVHPFRLAKGDRQRLAIASVVVLEPQVLIVDEPTTGQDPVKAREIMDVLVDLNRRRRTTILVITHAMDLVAEYAHRMAIMARGRLILNSAPREVFRLTEILKDAAIEPPPIVRAGAMLGMRPLPLTIQEFEERYRNP